MKEKDWIILRLIFVAIKTEKSHYSIDVVRSILYLSKTYGRKQLMQDIDRGLAIWFASRLDAREVVRRWWTTN